MEQNGPHDAELVAQTLAGNREAFAQLYDEPEVRVENTLSGSLTYPPGSSGLCAKTLARCCAI